MVDFNLDIDLTVFKSNFVLQYFVLQYTVVHIAVSVADNLYLNHLVDCFYTDDVIIKIEVPMEDVPMEGNSLAGTVYNNHCYCT